MILRDKNNTFMIRTGCYGKAAELALFSLEHFMTHYKIDGEVIRSTNGELCIAFNDRIKWIIERSPSVYWCQMESGMRGWCEPAAAGMAFMFQKIRGASPLELKMNFGAEDYERYVGKPFNMLVQSQLTVIEQALEDSKLDILQRRDLKMKYNKLVQDNVR